jgi:hypothetical protein
MRYHDIITTSIAVKINRLIAVLLIICLYSTGINGQRLSRDLCLDILTNQVGYLPDASKFCLIKGDTERSYQVIEAESQKIVFNGRMLPVHGDFGNYLTGDFSKVINTGVYYIKSDTSRSYPFRISKDVYNPVINSILHYFSLQRCGASSTGYLSPCHLDDGIRLDNGKHKDVSGGWHDASDLRKWVSATIYGMTGLLNAYELSSDAALRLRILDELKWGNLYFLKMQEPDGFIMDFIGGDLIRNSDNNRWTDNITGKDGGKDTLIRPNTGYSTSLMLVIGDKDDRVIQTSPADLPTQFRFAASEAAMFRITRKTDAGYAKKCLDAAIKCFEWCSNLRDKYDSTPEIYGAAIQASIELYKATKKVIYKNYAVQQAAGLRELQAKDSNDSISGFFYNSLKNKEPYKQILGSTEFISLCNLVEEFPSHQDTEVWKEMINKYINQYLLAIAKRNSFCLVPFGLYQTNPGGNRKAGNLWYRYFMQPELNWWVGINANAASAAIGLIKASHIFSNNTFSTIAQRELDWICGSNPFNSSTIIGCGYNQPPRYIPTSFVPGTPVIAGAVMNGLGGDHGDQPFIGEGIWQVSEYWTPMVATTLWLMKELEKE